jgi:3-oxoacyl-(acyl-carrier-protein) synthase
VCFVSICENIQGPNCIYTPWEGQGAQAIEAGMRAIRCGDARCALVGGCDVKTHELAFIALEQLGLFQSWKETQSGVVPGEGAVFLVLELESAAVIRRARVYACLANCASATSVEGSVRGTTCAGMIEKLMGAKAPGALQGLVSGADAISRTCNAESHVLASLGITVETSLSPKPQAGNLFAAAAALQVGLAALLVEQSGGRVLASCFGHGSELAAFLLEKS